jgi:hypothetical protein
LDDAAFLDGLALAQGAPMKKLAAVFAVALSLGAVACVAPTESGTVTEQSTGALQISERSETAFAGSFAHGASSIKFDTRIDSPAHVTLHLEVNGVVFDASFNQAARTAHWDGHNGALYADDLAALKAFMGSLEKLYNGEHPASLHEDVLVRRVSFWSEAPPGLTMPARDIKAEDKTGIKQIPNGVPTTEEQATAIGPEANHQGGDEDGIWYIKCYGYSTAVHDSNGHCKDWESIYGGKNSTDCHGKCGGGCGFGTAGYTYDCHDHDRCGRVHGGSTNPWDSECGDEYWEADDDYARSIIGKCI